MVPGARCHHRAGGAAQDSALILPVLAIGGQYSGGERVADGMKLAADDVPGVVIPGVGHWVAEEAPEELLAALTGFLAPYQEGR
jgi:pimeloyl-ACP methyl ester carboxylesterase